MTSGWTGLSSVAATRRDQADAVRDRDRGADLGVLTAPPTEKIIIGTSLWLTPVIPGHLPFVLAGLAVQCFDSAAGTLYLSLWRIAPKDLGTASWTARRSFEQQVGVSATRQELFVRAPLDKTIDRRDAVWLVGMRGSTPTMEVRGVKQQAAPALCGFKTTDGSATTVESNSDALARSQAMLSSVLLTKWGARLRGSAALPPA